SNQGAITKGNQIKNIIVPGAVVGQWNTVYIKPDPAVPGIVDLDRIRTYDFDTNLVAKFINGKADDRDIRLRYSGVDWTNIPLTGAYANTLKQTGVQNAYVTFRFYGNALTVFRMTGPGFADMQVTIDNSQSQTVSNLGTGSAVIRPYAIDNLPITYHVVQITK